VGRNAPNEENTQSPAEPVHEDEDYEELDPLDDIDELPPIDFKLYHNAKTEQRRQAASADYGDDDFVELTDDAGRVVIKPTLPRMSLGDLLEFEKIRRAEEAVQRERGAPPVRRPSAVRELLGKSKRNGTSTTMPEADAQPQAPRSSWNWLWKRFATPKKSTWR